MSAADDLKDIFEIEIGRLRIKAESTPLDEYEVKKLDMLTRAWRTYNATNKEPAKVEDMAMSTEELLELARVDIKT